MKKYLNVAFLCIISIASFAQSDTALTAGAARLFKSNKNKLTNVEKNWLFKQLDLTISPDKRLFKSGEYDVTAQAYATDMNKDAVAEIFMLMQSTALFGDAGEGFVLYIKNSKGVFEKQSEFGSGMVLILTTMKNGYPDIALGGPGFEFPVFSWDGKKYMNSNKKVKDADLQSKKIAYMDIAECSKLFTDTLK